MRVRGGAPQLERWRRSAEFREIALNQMRKINREKALRPKCKATSKNTGMRCGNVAMENGCCYRHGGKTPKGDEWHRLQWPKRSDPRAMQKANRKLQRVERQRRDNAKREAEMTEAQLIAHRRQIKAKRPSTAASRSRAQAEKEQNAYFAKQFSKAAAPPTPEIVALDKQISELEARLSALQVRPSRGVFD
jgi:hypothetical protein